MNHYEEMERGRHAEAVLENPAFASAFEQIEKEIVTQWKNSKDPSEREKLHLSLSLLQRLESVLKQALTNGKVAAQIVERQSRLGKLLQRD